METELDRYIKYFDNYRREEMEPRSWLPDKATQGWEDGLKFLLGHTFQRGRNVTLSDIYYASTVKVLELDKRQDFELFYGKFHDCQIINALLTQELIRQNRKPNHYDIKMVASSIDYQNKIVSKYGKDANLYTYLHDLIFNQPSQIRQAYNELDDIKWVGDKLATFTIRDIILGEQSAKINLTLEEYQLVFPVDRWVRKKGWELLEKYSKDSYYVKKGVSPHEDLRLKQGLIKLCQDLGLIQQDVTSPLKLNVGLWWDGAKK